MPEVWESLVKQLEKKNYSKNSAYAIATSTLTKAGELKPGTRELTKFGKQRNGLGHAGRHKDPLK